MDDYLTPDDRQQALSQGLLGLGAGLLSGSYGHYGALAPALGSGVQGFQQGYQGALTNALHLNMFKQQKALQDAQIQNYQSEVAKRQAELDEQKRLQGVQTGADSFARGMPPPSNAVAPTQPSYGVLAPPQGTAPPVGPGATALAGGAGPVGGAAGFGATGSPVPGAASSAPVESPKFAANGDQILPTVPVTGKAGNQLLDPDYWLRSSEYKRQHGDMKGAMADAEQSHKLRTEELTLSKDDRPKPLEGVPGITFDSKGFYEDGQPVKAARVQEVRNIAAQNAANKSITNVNAFTPASEEAQKEFMKSTRTTYDALKQSQVALDNIEKTKALIPQASGFMGSGGERTLNAVKFLNNRLGLKINTEGVKSAEELRSRTFQGIMDNLKKLDSQPSESQQESLRQALGSIDTDPNALGNVLDSFGDAIRGKVQLHNSEVQSAINRGVKFPYDPIIKIKGSDPMAPKQSAMTPKPVAGPMQVPPPQKPRMIPKGWKFTEEQ